MQQRTLDRSTASPNAGKAETREVAGLWVGQAVSRFGSGITDAALPLTAVLLLGATPGEMGWLVAVEAAPVLLVGMFAGVWVDRVRRRPLLIGADLGRAVLLGCIPLLAITNSLRIEHLFVVAAAGGVLTVLFDVAFRSFVPNLLGREAMLVANSRLATIDAVAEITTPGMTGALVQVIAAPLAVLLDALSFVVSAACMLGIRHAETARQESEEAEDIWSEIVQGWRAVIHNEVLRPLAGVEGLRNFFGMFFGTLYVLFGIRELGLSPLLIGITVGVGGVSNLLGTLVVQRVTRRLGVRRTMLAALVLGCIGPALIAVAPSVAIGAFVVLVIAQSVDFIHPLFDVNALTLRQVITPDYLLGRVNATIHVIGRGVVPFGALAGGALGDAVGMRGTLLIGAAGFVVATVWYAATTRHIQNEPT